MQGQQNFLRPLERLVFQILSECQNPTVKTDALIELTVMNQKIFDEVIHSEPFLLVCETLPPCLKKFTDLTNMFKCIDEPKFCLSC